MKENAKKDPRFAEFGERVYATRKGKGMTQEMLAEVAGLSVASIRRIEAGDTVSRRTIEAIEEALHITFNIKGCTGIYTCPEAHLCLREVMGYLAKLLDPEN